MESNTIYVITLCIKIEILKKVSVDGDLKELYAYIFVIGGAIVITLLIYLFQRKCSCNN